jgi:FixJ family two-component response regulator
MVFKLLTDRQGEVLRGLCDGRTEQEIADSFGISVTSVKQHTSAIRARTRQRSIPELCRQIAESAPPRTDKR